jgi:hypothetical protein
MRIGFPRHGGRNVIINFTMSNPQQLDEAYGASRRDVYGIPFLYEEQYKYKDFLNQGEDLFICADYKANTLGHPSAVPALNPEEFGIWLVGELIPWNYIGNIYIVTRQDASAFLDQLLTLLGRNYQGRIHGFTSADEQLPPPWHPEWVVANSDTDESLTLIHSQSA